MWCIYKPYSEYPCGASVLPFEIEKITFVRRRFIDRDNEEISEMPIYTLTDANLYDRSRKPHPITFNSYEDDIFETKEELIASL